MIFALRRKEEQRGGDKELPGEPPLQGRCCWGTGQRGRESQAGLDGWMVAPPSSGEDPPQNTHVLTAGPLSHGLSSTSCPIKSQHPRRGESFPAQFPQPGVPCSSLYHSPCSVSKPFPSFQQKPSSACPKELSFPDAPPPSPGVPEKILLF